MPKKDTGIPDKPSAFIEGEAQGGVETGQCLLERVTEPCCIVIFGATGDLTSRKLFPALHHLFVSGGLPERFAVVGASRSELDHDAFREKMREAAANGGGQPGHWEAMARHVFYQSIDYSKPESFDRLAVFLGELDEEMGLAGNRVFYLAVPPTAYKVISSRLGGAGMTRERSPDEGYSRLVVEKPFGHDLDSAMALDAALHESFEEHQIYRIDHYLAKETVQNVALLRFANSIFEPIWNRRYIQSVRITAAESLGVGHRAGYYDHAGVLRDMFQNHMMQLLSLCAMEPPSIFEGERVRDEKTKVYGALQPMNLDRLENRLVLGQYSSGVVEGEKVASYIDEPGVAEDSRTPTYAAMKVHLDNWRWQGVPFYLISGKRLAEKRTEIAVQFKEVPCSMFRHILGEHITTNRLTLGIQPREEISLTFQTKAPGPKVCLRSVLMHFDYYQGHQGPVLDAYEKVLLDVMMGDHTLFWRQDGVNLCWSFLTPILDACGERNMLYLYRAGSWGPQEASRVIPEDMELR
ncbi:glucose-6-phosphate dehydrogenase [Desulfohalovibrio reitneri]|uniref:glucose-6-phosphate dehydrogenase n=1 Tax=Desulfohalovibrio reitneri TaxID=1307759 RepID=UPI0009DE4DD6|nr:glucose-6-phosphate dehydrogenase [Desulfohalovibrio reitneri]